MQKWDGLRRREPMYAQAAPKVHPGNVPAAANGCSPPESSSHAVTPNAQTSLFSEKRRLRSASGGIQRNGRLSFDMAYTCEWYDRSVARPKSATFTRVAHGSRASKSKTRTLRRARSR
eukprot:scaffold253465_cov31-Tisochrysis_lutea.AAC.2